MSVAITVAPTGPVASKADNPNLPTQPHEIARDVAAAYKEGASVAHLHFRDTDDQPTADLGVARDTMEQIAELCPIHVQLSTGVGLSVPFEDRAALVELRPAMATLNPCTMTFGTTEFRNPPLQVRRLAGRMLELGVKPELEIYDLGHLDECLRLRDEGLVASERMQFSIVLGVRGGMAATAANLLAVVERLPEGAIWQVIALGKANLPLTAVALALGGNARAGMEDALYISRNVLATSNASLVARTRRVAESLQLTVANSTQVADTLGLAALEGSR